MSTDSFKSMCAELGNGNLSQGIRYALRFAAGQRATPARLSTILRSAAVMAARMESAND